MLLNNFKPLLFFGGSGTFTNVLGNTVNVSDFLTLLWSVNVYPVNGHQVAGAGRSFNYNTTTASNTCTSEQTGYTWYGISGSSGDNDSRYNGFILFVGSGNTAVTANDYCLASAVNLDVTAASCSTTSNGLITTTRTFENNTGSSVNIREVGLYIFSNAPWNDTTTNAVMVGRKILATPVVINNGEQRVFEYIVDMNHINFSSADS